MSDPKDYHTNAAALIIAAAETSGLLRDVAEALYFSNEHPDCCNGPSCLACGVLDKLADDFGEHISVGYDFYSEGFCLPSVSDAELAPFLGVVMPNTNSEEVATTAGS
jgi:hypothetical protein